MSALKVDLSKGDQKRVSALSGIAQSTISRIVSGVTRNPGIETVAKIEAAAKKLGLAEKTDEKQTASRDKTEASVAKPGA